MIAIDPPSRLFSTDQEWINFWVSMRRHPEDADAVEWFSEAAKELRSRGFNPDDLEQALKEAKADGARPD